MAIEIKTALTDFHEVSKQQARHYVEYLLREGLPNIADYDKKVAYINRKRLRGITVNELLDIKPKIRPKQIAVVQLTMDGEFIARFNSISDAFRATGATVTAISLVCQGDANSAKGFKWMYLDDYLKQGSDA